MRGESVLGPLAYTGLCTQACGPTVHRACGENMHVEGSCLLLGSQLQVVQRVPAAQPGRSPRAAVLWGARAGPGQGMRLGLHLQLRWPQC